MDHSFGSPIKPTFSKIEGALKKFEGVEHCLSENQAPCLVILNIHITDPSYWTSPLVNAGRGVPEPRGYFTVSQLLSPVRHNLSVDYLVIPRHPHGVYIDTDESVHFLSGGMEVEDAAELLLKSAHMRFTHLSPDTKHAVCEIAQVSSFGAILISKLYWFIRTLNTA